MRTLNRQITENDYVELVRDIGRWRSGTRGTAVSDHESWKLVEISDHQGQMLDLIEVDDRDLKLVTQHSSAA